MTESLETLVTRLDYLEKSIDKTEHALNERLMGMNEFRAALKDQTALYITRDQVETKLKSLESKVDMQQKFLYVGIGALLVLELLFRLLYK